MEALRRERTLTAKTEENRVVLTEMGEFLWGLHHDEETHKPDGEDVLVEEDVAAKALDQVTKEEPPALNRESAVGKGLSGALKLLKERGALEEGVELGGRNMDKKKIKIVDTCDKDGQKEIQIERRDEHGQELTEKEAFRVFSHQFHGKKPGKRKQEKRIRKYQEELKRKQMKFLGTPSLSVE